jgi:hypothetical protein
MAFTIPHEWGFQGWISFRTPWSLEPKLAARVGNALLSSCPGMTNVVFHENDRRISFTEKRGDAIRANVDLSPRIISFNLFFLQRAEEWAEFSGSVLEIIRTQTEVFEARFNLHEARQSVYIPVRDVQDPKLSLWGVLGKPGFVASLGQEDAITEIGVDQEYVFRSRHDQVKVILRFQFPGPSSPPYLRPGELMINLSTVLDPEASVVETISEKWAAAQSELLSWLTDRIYPYIIRPLLPPEEGGS